MDDQRLSFDLETLGLPQRREVRVFLPHHGLRAGHARRRESAELDRVALDGHDAVEAVAGSIAARAAFRRKLKRRPRATQYVGAREVFEPPGRSPQVNGRRFDLRRHFNGSRLRFRNRIHRWLIGQLEQHFDRLAGTVHPDAKFVLAQGENVGGVILAFLGNRQASIFITPGAESGLLVWRCHDERAVREEGASRARGHLLRFGDLPDLVDEGGSRVRGSRSRDRRWLRSRRRRGLRRFRPIAGDERQ